MQKYSEEKLGLPPQPSFSCPEINKLKRHVRKLRLLLYIQYKRDNISGEMYNILHDEILAIEEGFEYCRSQASDIRDWGYEWKKLCKKMINIYQPRLLHENDNYKRIGGLF